MLTLSASQLNELAGKLVERRLTDAIFLGPVTVRRIQLIVLWNASLCKDRLIILIWNLMLTLRKFLLKLVVRLDQIFKVRPFVLVPKLVRVPLRLFKSDFLVF